MINMFFDIVNWILTNIFGNVAIFMGLLVFIGLLVSGKKFHEALAGFIKATVGYLVFTVAADGFTEQFRPILFSAKEIFGSNVLVLDGYYGMSIINTLAESLGRAASLYTIGMVILFGVSLVLVYFRKITKFRCVNIAGNTLNGYSISAFIFALSIWPEIPDAWLLVFIVAFGLLDLAYANLIVEDVQEFTDGAGFTVYHTQTLLIKLADIIGNRISKKAEKEGKEVKRWSTVSLPGWMDIFSDITVSSTFVMLIVFGALMLMIGKENIAINDPSVLTVDFPVYIFRKALMFGCYISILTTGIRMFVSELSVAFNGLSDKVLRGGVPALDIAVTMGFMENPSVLTIGFFIGTTVNIILAGILFGFGSPFVAIMGFTSLFFEHGPIAAFADRKGGIKCQMIMNVITSVVQVVIAGGMAYLMGAAKFGGMGVSSNWAIELVAIMPLLKYAGVIGVVIVLVIALGLPWVQYFMHKDTYYLATEDWEEYKKVKALKSM